MDGATEQKLLERCRRGNLGAFKPLVDAYYARAVRVAGALVGAGDAEDLAQEAFVAAYSAIETHQPGRPFYPWLRGILVNRAKVAIRTRNRRRDRAVAAAERPGSWALQERGANPAAEDLVRRALVRLDAADRELILAKHVEGQSYDELAAQFEIPRGTVMSRLYRARQRLKLVIEELDPSFAAAAAEGEQ